MAHQRCVHHSLCRANDAQFQQSRKVVLIFASAKKEKRNCKQSFILLGSLILPLRRRIGKSDHRQTRVLSPLCVFLWEKSWDFAFTFLDQKSQSSWSRKVRLQRSARRICDHTSTKMDWKIWWSLSQSECSPLSSCAWNSGFIFLAEKSQSNWPSTMHASQFVQDSEYKTVLTIKKNVHLSLATENTVSLQSFWSPILSYSDLWSHTVYHSQPNREQTAAIVPLSFSSKDVRNW
jgi:hypothetical protein